MKKLAGNLEVSPLGLGCMGFSQSYPPFLEKKESIKSIRGAFDIGYTLFDTAEVYGPFTNEELLGEALEPIRNEVVIATKFGHNLHGRFPAERRLTSEKEDIRLAIEGSLKRLRTDRIDLLYQHRVDPLVPIEEVALEMEKLIKEGKVLHWGLSEASQKTIRAAHAVCPLTAVQSEYSLFFRDHEKDTIPLCEKLGIGFVAFSPLGRQMLTGEIKKGSVFPEGDFRHDAPKYLGKNLEANLELVDFVKARAEKKGCTAAQFALAWTMAKHDFIVPIPGTKNMGRMRENFDSRSVRFTKEELEAIDDALGKIKLAGNRYNAVMDAQLDKDTP
ncbi:MAG: aldo/keto reductase [Clostridia bacterium]|nr:aldo/keto reductase [Clostridia bacterium]